MKTQQMASLLNNTGVWFIYYLSTIELEKKDFFIYRNKYYYLTQKDKYYLLLIGNNAEGWHVIRKSTPYEKH